MAARASYGFDAPDIMRNLLAGGAACLVLGLAGGALQSGAARVALLAVAALALVPLALGAMMVAYGIAGKHRMRDLMMSRWNWRGDEQVLDVGAGRGLLLAGAAGKLNAGGHAIGIDIWRAEDLSGNTLETARRNMQIENVADRISLMSEDARRLPFETGRFDVVFSLYCIHNIEHEEGRERALSEIARTLKPGGKAMIAEWMPIPGYGSVLRRYGLVVETYHSHFATALAPMWMIEARKPVAS